MDIEPSITPTPEIPDSNLSVQDSKKITPSKDNPFGLTSKQSRFVTAYIELNDATKACIVAGYSPRSANVEANRMLKRDSVINALKDWRKSKREQLTKNDFVGLAMESFEQLDVTEPNKPRFLDIAGKGLGYLGSTQPSVTNNTQINIKGDVSIMPSGDKWAALRSIMDNT